MIFTTSNKKSFRAEKKKRAAHSSYIRSLFFYPLIFFNAFKSIIFYQSSETRNGLGICVLFSAYLFSHSALRSLY